MLGIIGFLTAAVVIAAFVWSSQRTYSMVDPLRLKAFCLAFALLAIAMVAWAVTIVGNDSIAIQKLMLFADTLLLLGSASMAVVILGKVSTPLLAALGSLVATGVVFRAINEPSTAFVRDGLLYFNLQGTSRLFIVGLFAFIWLPAAMIVAGQLASSSLLAKHRLSLQMYFVLLVALLAMFSKAKRSQAIILLFVLIILVFLILLVFNYSLLKTQAIEKRERSSGHAPKHTHAK